MTIDESRPLRALDLFAGTGWGVACRRLGIREMGVENMPEAIATRALNGMPTLFLDVWDGLDGRLHIPAHQLVIASPPCQTFSPAGNGAGRRALDDVLEAIDVHAYKDPAALRAFGVKHDPRTALVLTPLAYVHRDRPEFVVLEQVPAVLPVWEAYAETMTGWGYDVKVAILNAEQYGVPQTRRRAVLVASLSGAAALPEPTHSRYYIQDPGRLDPGVLPWVSMREALGWGGSGEYPVARKNMGKGMVERYGDRPGRPADAPAFTIRASAGGMEPGGFVVQEEPGGLTRKLSVDEAAILQTYPAPSYLRSNYGTGGDPARRGVRTIDQPAPTVTSKIDRNKWDGKDPVTAAQAAALQTYPEDFQWAGPATKRFLQIGNAVPPLLAEAILAALPGLRAGR